MLTKVRLKDNFPILGWPTENDGKKQITQTRVVYIDFKLG